MYSLHGLIGRRGFWLNREGQILFQTRHKLGLFPNSFAKISGVDFRINLANLLGDKWNIRKNGDVIGQLDFSHYQYSVIALNRLDGGVDKFRLDEDGYSQVFILTGKSGALMRFKRSINPLRIDDKYDVELLLDIYPETVLIELIFYAGEILFRKTNPDASPI